jgi:hypothetical protein
MEWSEIVANEKPASSAALARYTRSLVRSFPRVDCPNDFVASSLRIANAEELGDIDPAKELRRISLKYPAVPSLYVMRG